jgi:hypothetical protein
MEVKNEKTNRYFSIVAIRLRSDPADDQTD